MIRINTSDAYKLGQLLQAFKSDFSHRTRKEIAHNVTKVRASIKALILDSEFGQHMKVTRPPAQMFDRLCNDLLEHPEQEQPIGVELVAQMRELANGIETVLLSELDVSATYFVTNKKGWTADALIENGQIIFADGIEQRCPDAINDLRWAAQCLAFEMPTSAGFHLHRAHEVVILALCKHATGGTFSCNPKNRNLGAYIRILRAAKVSDKITNNIQSIKDFHRNTLMHPDESLTNEEAYILIGIINSSIASMLPLIPIDAPRLEGP